ncbi:MAG TPA: response regulator [Ignavibacteriales bacterium]|nr:response regulator [Ignavibacteriales bacterium]HOL81613.1 response regulator [Ignavibacteriales bacterium]HOM65557.1 response regulator [Ignavibacteriales bacterium]HPD67881.1 response regulator [Ignavibacteriales bacterium]HPP33727.1 response regulator [Ignavibacteriales bacterium]
MIKDLKILIVDNDKMVRLLLNRLISKKFKAEVLEAEDGLQALTVIKEKKPHLILLDITMPIMDGVEVMQNLRATEEFKDLPVIIMSSTDEKNTVMKLVQLKISDYILKPIDISKAYERIQSVLEKLERESNIPKPVIQKEEAEEKVETTQNLAKKLLIVHTNENYRAELKNYFVNEFEVFEATTGIEALQIFIKQNTNYVIMGDGISLINEISLTKKMKEKNTNSKIAFIYTVNKPVEENLFVTVQHKDLDVNTLSLNILNSFK